MKRIQRFGLLAGLLLAWQGLALHAHAAPGRTFEAAVQKVEAKIEPAEAKRGQTVTWKLTLELAPGWHTYPTEQVDANAKSFVDAIKFTATDGTAVVGKLKEPTALSKAEPDLQIQKLLYYEGKVVWEQSLVVAPDTQPGSKHIKASVKLLICDKDNCLPAKTVPLEATLTVSDGGQVSVAPQYPDQVKPSPAPAVAPQASEAGPYPEVGAEDHQADLEVVQAQIKAGEPSAKTVDQKMIHSGLLAFVLSGVFWGAVSLVTPCVFPMIPITVSFFLKQSEKEHHRPFMMALVYCLTIVIVLTVAAVALLSFFRWLSVNPVMNFGLGALFIFFSLSLFGMYEIELPSGLARFTSSREGRGGLAGTMFMALTFTIVSFACVAPFLGGFGGTVATSQLTWPEKILGGLAFSATFAAPFFILAIFPSLLKKMPKSGSWLNSVKVVMGFLELAAALKFFRAGELVLLAKPAFFTYDFVLGIWIALAILCGLYLLNLYRLPHDTPVEHLSVPRLMASLLFVGLSFYLMPALFKVNAEGEKQRPNGAIYAWIDSFLLPEGKNDMAWSPDLKRAIDEARAYRQRTGKPKLVFVDFTGETCTNCKKNEATVFSKPDIKALFKPYELVQLYTDKVPNDLYPAAVRARFGGSVDRQLADAAANLWFQKATFNTEQLPLYVILEPLPEGKVRAEVYGEGLINSEESFAEFLKKPLANEAQLTQARAGN